MAFSNAFLGNRLTVDQRTLTPLVLVRIQVPQPPRSLAFSPPSVRRRYGFRNCDGKLVKPVPLSGGQPPVAGIALPFGAELEAHGPLPCRLALHSQLGLQAFDV